MWTDRHTDITKLILFTILRKRLIKKKAYWNASADFLLRRDERSLRRTTQCKKLATGAPNDAAHRFHHGVLYFLTIVQSNSTNVN
jgi:hypothetical protein